MKNKKILIRFAYRFLIDAMLILLASVVLKPLAQSHFDSALAEDLAVSSESTPLDSGEMGYPYTKTFKISAYYSPLACQNRYVTGSYEGDIKLNGRGVRGADGTGVYPGMVAAPKTFQFGTKMDIPGIGIVAVHDRGGAIVASNGQAGVYDRLDIWMGYGDVGLKRALNWGKRTVDVVVYGQNDSIVEQISLDGYSADEAIPNCGGQVIAETSVADAPKPEFKAEEVKPEVKPEVNIEDGKKQFTPEKEVTKKDKSITYKLQEDLKFGSNGEDVKELQRELRKLNFYRGEITGYFGNLTEHAVFKFQQSQSLVADESSTGSGIFGPKTRDRMNEIIASRYYNTTLIATNTASYEKKILARRKGVFIASELSFGMTGPQVAKLQQFLKDKGFFDGVLVTEYFGNVTKNAVVKFQRENKLIGSENDSNAGNVNGQTLELINILS